jgi:1,4-dihydroxy-2-naphthoate octaprenyltransferase
MSFKNMFLETRPQFLLLSPVLAFLGMSIALYNGSFDTLYFILTIIGLTLLHASVNTLNDYSDYKTGIDLKSNRTPFSGGSGFLPSGLLKPSTVLAIGLGSIILATPIGIYFLFERGMELLPLFIIGAILVLFYTSFITRIGLGLAEISAGLGLGVLPVIGTFIIIHGNFSYPALYASMPSFFLVFNLLLLNELPDAEADKTGKRKTLPIQFGIRAAAAVYSAAVILTYIWILAHGGAYPRPGGQRHDGASDPTAFGHRLYAGLDVLILSNIVIARPPTGGRGPWQSLTYRRVACFFGETE